MSGLTVLADTEIVRVGDVAEQVRGVSYSKADVRTAPQPGYIPLLRGGNVREHGLAFDDLQFVPGTGVSQKQILRAGDIVVVASSGSLSGVGKAACVPSGFRGTFGAFCKVIRPTDKIDASYLGHYFRTADYRSRVSSMAGGANINNLRNEHLDGLRIRLPALHEQRRIAAILDKADALRTKRRQALAHLEVLTQSIFHSMFGDAASNPREFPKRELVELCASRDDIRCGPFGTQLSKKEFRSSGVPLWGIKNVNRSFELPTHEFLEPATAERLDAYSILPGDIVMTRKGTVGNCSVYPKELPRGIMHSDLLRLRINPNIANVRFISDQLHSSRDVAHQVSLISRGAIMAGINVAKLKIIKVLAPPLADQEEYARRVSSVDVLRSRYLRQSVELDTLFASLQHRAFSGQL
jgi:type I restriction enzyme S subunit